MPHSSPASRSEIDVLGSVKRRRGTLWLPRILRVSLAPLSLLALPVAGHSARLVDRQHRDLIAQGSETGVLRDDVAPGELASYCLHALTAAASLPSKAAIGRLIAVTMAGLRASR